MGYTPHPYGNQLDPDLAEPGASFWDILWANIAYSGYMRYLERGPIHPDDHGFEKCRVCSLEYRHHTNQTHPTCLLYTSPSPRDS